ncbi:MAG: hypothetical protein E6Q64_08975, partial [Ottowia sp.]
MRAGSDHAAGGHEPVCGARHPPRWWLDPRCHRRRPALCVHPAGLLPPADRLPGHRHLVAGADVSATAFTTTDTPLWQWPATALAQAYRSGALSPVDVLRASLARIDHVQPTLNAFVARRDAVWAEAKASAQRHRAGRPLSLLDGVPVSVKDNLCLTDAPTVWGSPALRAHRPAARDEWTVARLGA